MIYNMENNEYNPNDYQGRRKSQVDSSNKIGAICVLLALLMVLLIFILN